MLFNLRKLIHWVKTGEELPESEPIVWNGDEGQVEGSPYTIQIKENLLASIYERWQWRLTKEGKEAKFPRVWTHGAESSKGRAISSAKSAIKEIEQHLRNRQQRWEDV